MSAPVVDGMILTAAALAFLRSFAGPSTIFWVEVYPWMVEKKQASIPNSFLITDRTGATELVVHDAFEMIWVVFLLYDLWLTPTTTVLYFTGQTASHLHGAEITTFFAPAFMCFSASTGFLKKPVASITTSTLRSFQGKSWGSFLAKIGTFCFPINNAF